MALEHLPIHVSPEVFKIKDPRVARVASGHMSHQAFLLSITESDPFYLIQDTIYALTEQEYYAMRSLTPVDALTNDMFHKILNLEDKSFMHQIDRDFLDKVKKELPTCPMCRYKRYKDEVYKLAKKYNISMPPVDYESALDTAEYPETTGEVLPVISMMVDHLYSIPIPVRKPCIDCVEKHLSQALILANEAHMGYPEHISMMIGHIAEAMEELPKQFVDLYSTLEFCLARTNYTKKAFLPLQAILPLLKVARKALAQAHEDQQDVKPDNHSTEMVLDFTDDMKAKMDGTLSASTVARLLDYMSRVSNIIQEYKISETDENRMYYEGLMANAANLMAQQCPEFAQMLRNRRLLFTGNPGLAAEAGYDCSDIVTWLRLAYYS